MKLRTLRLALPTIAVLSLPSPGLSAPKSKTFNLTHLDTAEGVEEYTLPNGLRVLLFRETSRPQITVNITYLVGSRHEGYGESGMAHLLEHMLFKGTKRHRQILELYANRGGMTNGTTWYDRTNYFSTMPSSPDNLSFLLDAESDRMINSLISADDLAKEFSVVRNEFERVENNHQSVLSLSLLNQAFQWHGYGRATIGSRADIEKVPVDKLREFYRKYYQPDNAVLIIGGDFDPAFAKQQIAKYFGPIAKPTRVLLPTYTVEPAQEGPRQFVLHRTTDQALTSVLYKTEAGTHEAIPAIEAAGDALTRKPTGFLYKALVEKGLASEVSYAAYRNAEPSVIMFQAKVNPGQNPEVVGQKMASLIEGFDFTSLGEKDVKRYQADQHKYFAKVAADTPTFVDDLSEAVAIGHWKFSFVIRQRIDALTPKDFASVGSYFQPNNRTLGSVIPTPKVTLPSDRTAPSLDTVKAYSSRNAKAGNAPVLPADLNALQSKVETFQLKSGLKATILAHPFRGDRISMHIVLPFGSKEGLANRNVAVKTLAPMLLRGTASKDATELADSLLLLESEIIPFTDFSYEGQNAIQFKAETSVENLDEFLKLWTEILRKPRFDADEFALMKKEILGSLRGNLQDPAYLAKRELLRSFLPYEASDIRSIPSLQAEYDALEKLQLKDLKDLHATLLGANHGQLIVVGNVQKDRLKRDLDTLLGDWNSKGSFESLAVKLQAPNRSSQRIDTPNKKMARVGIASLINLKPTDADYPALLMAVHTFGISGTNRLWTRLREKEGLSYGTGSSLAPAYGANEGTALFSYAICAASNADRALALMQEEYTRLTAQGITEEELQRVVKAYLEDRKNELASPDSLSQLLLANAKHQLDLKQLAEIDSKVGKLTVAEVNAAVKKYLSPKPALSISVLDEKQKGASL
jgi:zinc protease